MLKRVRLMLTVMLLLAAVGVNAQFTTSSMSGKVEDMQKEPIIGATIQAVHEASGTRYGAITNVDGRFSIQGMRTGKYTVEISFIGYQSVKVKDVTLQLGVNYPIDVFMKESSELLDEVVVLGTASKFSGVKTGATTNVSNEQMQLLPSIDRSLSDFTRLSPYSGAGNTLSGRDGRTNTFTIDGANLNNNFGLSSTLPGGGNPISLDAIEELQVVVAPFDVRQTNFVGGGVNAITKSGTNMFRGSAYTYQKNEKFRGNKVDGYDLGERAEESKEVYGVTFGGPIIKNKLFFFVNGEYENQPEPVTKYRLSTDGKIDENNSLISRVTAQNMQGFADILQNTYGYNPGSYTDYSGGTKNYKFLGRIDWNITDAHKLSVRYNYTTNSQDLPTNGTSTVGNRTSANRISQYAMAFRNNCYSMDNTVWSLTAELNSRFGNNLANRFLFTYSNIEDMRGSLSSPFPHIDVWDGTGQAFMSAGYELFSWNNGVKNNTLNIQDNITWTLGKHKIIGGLSYEYQKASNSFMRFGTGYYKFASFEDFQNGNAPISFGLTYGYNGNLNPSPEVSFAQSALYLQDEWDISDHFKLTYGVRADLLTFLTDLETNEAYKKLDWKDHFVAKDESGYANYKAPVIDTGKWPSTSVLFSPRVGFNWDVTGDRTLVVRGGTGVFTGRVPLVFFTNMPTNAMMLQNTVQYSDAKDKDGNYVYQATFDKLAAGGKYPTTVDEMIKVLGLPTSSPYSDANAEVKGAAVVGIADDFKLPQVWKNSLAVDYRLPLTFPMTLTVEAMVNKDINAVSMENYNVTNVGNLERFAGSDDRYNYRTGENVQSGVTGGAVVLKNTSKGYSSSINAMLTAQPVSNLNLMFSYTHTVSKEITGLPGNQAYSSWQNLYSVNGPNEAGLSSSQYVTPNKVIASASYRIKEGKNLATNIGLYYAGYNSGTYSYVYNNDMNGDGSSYDLLYIPKTKDELQFMDVNLEDGTIVTAETQRDIFWRFIEQDDYLSSRKGKYAEAYGAKMPWVHRFDLKVAQDFKLKVGKTMNTLQISLDILNVGNLLNSAWGVTKTTSSCNNAKLLNYMKTDENNRPVYSLYSYVSKDKYYQTPTLTDKSTTFTTYKNSSNCWQLQIGVRYIFN